MKKTILAATLGLVASASVMAQTAISASIGINRPGVYGRVDIGTPPPEPTVVYQPAPIYQQPAVIYAKPIVIAPTPVAVHQRPIYLYVPPEHHHDWRKWCHHYGACGQPVYFVQETWVRDRYAHYDSERHHHDDHGRGHDHDHDHDRDRHHDQGNNGREYRHGRD